jgi:hypothetical protein
MKNGLDRRNFLKVTTHGTAIAGIIGVAGKLQIPAVLAAQAAKIDNPSPLEDCGTERAVDICRYQMLWRNRRRSPFWLRLRPRGK